MSNDELRVEVRDKRLVISIGIDTLAWSFAHHPSAYDDEGELRKDWPKVTDPEQFANDVRDELRREMEDGSTPVHFLLDAATMEACEQGSMGLDFDTQEAQP